MKNINTLLLLIILGTALAGCAILSNSDNIFAVKIANKYGFINNEGREVIENKFEETSAFSEGLCAVKFQGKWGYIDKSGEFKIIPQYKKASDFKNSLAYVHSDEREGYINKVGEFVWYKEAIAPKQNEEIQNKTKKAVHKVPTRVNKANRDFVQKILDDTSDVLP